MYTKSELTVKKYPLQKAIDNARKLLGNKPMCVDTLRCWPKEDLYTLAEINDITEELVNDTKYWG